MTMPFPNGPSRFRSAFAALVLAVGVVGVGGALALSSDSHAEGGTAPQPAAPVAPSEGIKPRSPTPKMGDSDKGGGYTPTDEKVLNDLEKAKIDEELAEIAGQGTENDPLKITPVVDMTEWFPKPGDQGNQGSCVGWALAYGMASYFEAYETMKPIRFSPAFVFNSATDAGCNGSSIVEAMNFMRTVGNVPWEMFPYTDTSCARKPTDEQKAAAGRWRIGAWVNLSGGATKFNSQKAKLLLYDRRPIMIGMQLSDEFMSLGQGAVWERFGRTDRVGMHAYHALVIIGYDDKKGAKGAFKILNSWGTGWGSGGYGWVGYDVAAERIIESHVILDLPNDKPPATWKLDSTRPVSVPAKSLKGFFEGLGLPPLFADNLPTGTNMALKVDLDMNIQGNKASGSLTYTLDLVGPTGTPLGLQMRVSGTMSGIVSGSRIDTTWEPTKVKGDITNSLVLTALMTTLGTYAPRAAVEGDENEGYYVVNDKKIPISRWKEDGWWPWAKKNLDGVFVGRVMPGSREMRAVMQTLGTRVDLPLCAEGQSCK